MIAHRESYVFDSECKFCAQEKSSFCLVSQVNTKYLRGLLHLVVGLCGIEQPRH